MNKIIVKNSVSLSRNIDKFPFPVGLTYSNSINVEDEIRKNVMDTKFFEKLEMQYFNMTKIDDMEKRYLIAKEIITRKLARNSIDSSAFYSNEVSILINEEDHIKINGFSSSKPIEEIFENINEIDCEMENKFNYAYDLTFGYLTSRITEIGTGLHIKAIIHLPALTITNYINKVIYAVGQIGVSLRKYKRENIGEFENFYEISNLITIGKTEKEIIENVNEIIKRIEKKERDAMETIMISMEKQMVDKIFRAYGTLKFARLLKYSEAITNLSRVRMGIELGFFDEIKKFDDLFFQLMPEEIFRKKGKLLLGSEEDEIRATIVRESIL